MRLKPHLGRVPIAKSWVFLGIVLKHLRKKIIGRWNGGIKNKIITTSQT